jgi:tetratricopeptide (TPR) repeat protein
MEERFGQPQQLHQYLREAADAAQEHNAPAVGAHALRRLAVIEGRQGHVKESARLRLEAKSLAREHGNLRTLARTIQDDAVDQYRGGRHPEALVSVRRALRLFRDLGDRVNEARALNTMGVSYFMERKLKEARVCWRTALKRLPADSERTVEADVLGNLGLLEQELANYDSAEALMLRCIWLRQLIGARRPEGLDVGYLGSLFQQRGRFEEARTYYTQAVTILEDVEFGRYLPFFQGCLASVHALLGDLPQAHDFFAQPPECDDDDIGTALELLQGIVECAEGKYARAESRLAAAQSPGPDGRGDVERSDDTRLAARLLQSALSPATE